MKTLFLTLVIFVTVTTHAQTLKDANEEVDKLWIAVNTFYKRTDATNAQIKTLSADIAAKNKTIVALSAKTKVLEDSIKSLNKRMITALKTVKIQGKPGEITLSYINGVYVISLSKTSLRKINKAASVATKLEEALK